MQAVTSTSFVFSAGRCGTQWLARTLSEHYSDLAETQHEPLVHKYYPRRLLRSDVPLQDHPDFQVLCSHISHISTVIQVRSYIETGWPSFVAVPLFCRIFSDTVRVIHLTRHPVYSACSMVTHRYYESLRRDGYTLHGFLQPFDMGVLFKHYAERWRGMSVYEKCLFHWAEINAYGLELRRSYEGSVPWLQIQMEQLLDPQNDRFAELLEFLGLPVRRGALAAVPKSFDQHQTHTDLTIHWEEIRDHPDFLDLAASLGYDAEAVSARRIEERYRR
jgi:hypothetical protein